MALSTLMPQFLVGTTFGASLLLSGVANPATVISQFTLQDFHMLIAFLTASSLSAIIIYASNVSGYATLSPRSSSDYGWLGRYGGNVIGGAMQGIAMAMTGACPGTVLVQTAMGWGMGPSIMVGGVIGGGLFIVLGDSLKTKNVIAQRRQTAEVKTFQEKLSLTTEQMVVLYEVIMGSVIASASLLAPINIPGRKAFLGGCLIGLAQASSVLFSKKTLGVSTAYQDIAGHSIGLLGGSRNRPGWGSIVFAAGVMGGAKLVGRYASVAWPTVGVVDITTNAAIVGGALSIFGSRLAGGCTSGHGISGCSTLSISSLITVASMFGGGIAFKMLLG